MSWTVVIFNALYLVLKWLLNEHVARSQSYLQSKIVLRNFLIHVENLKPGANSRQCAQRGIKDVERGIKDVEDSIMEKGWIESSILYMTVDAASEANFRLALPQYRIFTAIDLLPEEHRDISFNKNLVDWLLQERLFILIDGHHCVMAIRNLKELMVPDLPEKIRYIE